MTVRGEYWWIRLLANGVDWAQCRSTDTVPLREGHVETLREVPAPVGASIVLCVPGERVRVHAVTLPTSNRKQILAALPYALEDRLLHDITDYHLVPLPAAYGNRDIPVAVVEKSWLAALLDQCREAGWHPRLLAPDYLFMPESGPGLWHIDASEPLLLLRKPGRDGAVLRSDSLRQLPGTLRLALEQSGTAPERLNVRVRTTEQYKMVTAWSEWLSERAINLDVYLDEQPQSSWLARQPLPDIRSSLLIGPFAVKQTVWSGPGRLKTSLALASVVLVVTMMHWFIQGARMQREYDQLNQAMEQTYRQVFPEAVNIVDPRYQMEQELKRLRSAGTASADSGSFLQRLDALAQVLSLQPDCRLQQISFDGSTILLEISVADYESFERLQQQLGQVTSISVENAELKDGRVQGRIRAGGKA